MKENAELIELQEFLKRNDIELKFRIYLGNDGSDVYILEPTSQFITYEGKVVINLREVY